MRKHAPLNYRGIYSVQQTYGKSRRLKQYIFKSDKTRKRERVWECILILIFLPSLSGFPPLGGRG